GEASQAAAWTRQALTRKERIMGMGHRVYRQADPRAEFLRQELLALRHRPEVGRWLDIALEVERVVREAKGLHPNPDFFTAILYGRSEEHTSELQSRENLVCRLLLEKKKTKKLNKLNK